MSLPIPAKMLVPCPFCPSKDIEIQSFSGDYSEVLHYCKCMKCGAEGPKRKIVHEAAFAWSQRHSNLAIEPCMVEIRNNQVVIDGLTVASYDGWHRYTFFRPVSDSELYAIGKALVDFVKAVEA